MLSLRSGLHDLRSVEATSIYSHSIVAGGFEEMS